MGKDNQWHDAKGSYGSIEEMQKAATQKITSQQLPGVLKQTEAFVDSLEPGIYVFQYPLAIWEIIKSGKLILLRTGTDRVEVRKD